MSSRKTWESKGRLSGWRHFRRAWSALLTFDPSMLPKAEERGRSLLVDSGWAPGPPRELVVVPGTPFAYRIMCPKIVQLVWISGADHQMVCFPLFGAREVHEHLPTESKALSHFFGQHFIVRALRGVQGDYKVFKTKSLYKLHPRIS